MNQWTLLKELCSCWESDYHFCILLNAFIARIILTQTGLYQIQERSLYYYLFIVVVVVVIFLVFRFLISPFCVTHNQKIWSFM